MAVFFRELFNGTLGTEISLSDRLAHGVPGATQNGANNTLWSNVLVQIAEYLIRSEGSVAVVAGSQDVTFSSDFGTEDYSLHIYDINGIGVQITAQASDKFTIDCLGSGTINYIAIKDI